MKAPTFIVQMTTAVHIVILALRLLKYLRRLPEIILTEIIHEYRLWAQTYFYRLLTNEIQLGQQQLTLLPLTNEDMV